MSSLRPLRKPTGPGKPAPVLPEHEKDPLTDLLNRFDKLEFDSYARITQLNTEIAGLNSDIERYNEPLKRATRMAGFWGGVSVTLFSFAMYQSVTNWQWKLLVGWFVVAMVTVFTWLALYGRYDLVQDRNRLVHERWKRKMDVSFEQNILDEISRRKREAKLDFDVVRRFYPTRPSRITGLPR